MTGKDKFEQDIIALIKKENRRRKIGRSYTLWHVQRIINRLLDEIKEEYET